MPCSTLFTGEGRVCRVVTEAVIVQSFALFSGGSGHCKTKEIEKGEAHRTIHRVLPIVKEIAY